jgi:hypothetical protein
MLASSFGRRPLRSEFELALDFAALVVVCLAFSWLFGFGSWRTMVKGLMMPMPFAGVHHRTRNFLDRAEKRKKKQYMY